MTTTKQIKARAMRVDRDRRTIERSALRKLTAVTGKALRHAGHAVRLGIDPTQAVRDAIMGNAALGLPGMVPTFTRAMVIADLYGRRRTALDAPRAGLELSAAEDDIERQRKRDREMAALLLLLGLSGASLGALYADYRPQAQAAAERIAQQAERVVIESGGVPTRFDPIAARHPRYSPSARPATPNPQRIADLRSAPVSRSVSPIEPPAVQIRRIADGFASGGLTIENSYGLEREVAKAVVQKYEMGRGVGTPAAVETMWGFHYCAILDKRTTELCRKLDGTTAPKDDSFWKTFGPPNHWNCRSLVLPVWKSTALREPSIIQPYASVEDIARFLEIKRQFLSYQ